MTSTAVEAISLTKSSGRQLGLFELGKDRKERAWADLLDRNLLAAI